MLYHRALFTCRSGTAMSLDSSPLPCSILLLAGGRGQRMGGQDKGLLAWRGAPLIAHLQRLTRPLTDDLIISCNRNQDRYAHYADYLVSDDSPDFPARSPASAQGWQPRAIHTCWYCRVTCQTSTRNY